ncbi:hypothetical protein HYT55_04130 [Candidatus Woesearchaeota archaeon]|nr:hypothetical protein [Candidatus Woesearchaeota archaeon]
MTRLLLTLGEKKCDYCCHALPAIGNSSWDGKEDSLHYKHVDCSRCGKENWLKLDFHGSGHDGILENKTIESIIRKVAER